MGKLNAKQILDKCGSSLLSGTDVHNAGQEQVTVKVRAVREPQAGFGSPIIMDIAEHSDFPDKRSVPINATNLRALSRMGHDELEKVAGQFVTFKVYETQDPRDNSNTFGLLLLSVARIAPAATKPSKPAPRGKRKPATRTKGRPARTPLEAPTAE